MGGGKEFSGRDWEKARKDLEEMVLYDGLIILSDQRTTAESRARNFRNHLRKLMSRTPQIEKVRPGIYRILFRGEYPSKAEQEALEDLSWLMDDFRIEHTIYMTRGMTVEYMDDFMYSWAYPLWAWWKKQTLEWLTKKPDSRPP